MGTPPTERTTTWPASRSTRPARRSTGSPSGTPAAPTAWCPTRCPRWRHNMRVLSTDLRFEMSLARWKRLDPTLKALAVMASAVSIGCSWCVDFGYWETTNRGVDPVEDARRPALAGQRRLHRPGAAGHGLRRGGDGDAARGDRRDGRRPAAAAGRRAAGRAHHDGGRGERPVAVQQRARADQPGLQGPLRDPGAAPRS